MNYYEMTTEQLETLKSSIEEKIDAYIGMSFASSRSEYVTYEIDSVDTDEILINANHDYKGLIRDYTVTIDGGVDDDVEYNIYNAYEEIADGGYMSFHRLPKDVQNAIIEIYEFYKDLETIDNILDSRSEEEEEEEEEEKDTEGEVDNLQKTMLEYNHSINKQSTKEVNTMNRIEAYNAYTVDRDFRYIANALDFNGFDYDNEDADFKAKLEQDEKLGELLEQFEDIESSQFLMYSQNTTDFYQKHEYDILSYLKTYGYDDNDNLQPLEEIMSSRVTAYVTGVLSEYGY